MKIRVITYPILIIFVAFLFSQKGKSVRNTDPEFRKYIKEIKKIYVACGKKHLVSEIEETSISFKKLDNYIYGQCFMYLKRIEINRAGWLFLEDYEKEELLLHELGHCVLKKYDTETESIMKGKGGLLGIKFTQRYNDYINEYFGCTEKKCCNLRYDWNKYNE